jgi:hypothetical protein
MKEGNYTTNDQNFQPLKINQQTSFMSNILKNNNT